MLAAAPQPPYIHIATRIARLPISIPPYLHVATHTTRPQNPRPPYRYAYNASPDIRPSDPPRPYTYNAPPDLQTSIKTVDADAASAEWRTFAGQIEREAHRNGVSASAWSVELKSQLPAGLSRSRCEMKNSLPSFLLKRCWFDHHRTTDGVVLLEGTKPVPSPSAGKGT